MELYQQGAAVSIFTYAIMSWLKRYVSKNFLPSVSIIVACSLAGAISYTFGCDWKQTVISGLAGGVSSMGLHDTVRSTQRKKESKL